METQPDTVQWRHRVYCHYLSADAALALRNASIAKDGGAKFTSLCKPIVLDTHAHPAIRERLLMDLIDCGSSGWRYRAAKMITTLAPSNVHGWVRLAALAHERGYQRVFAKAREAAIALASQDGHAVLHSVLTGAPPPPLSESERADGMAMLAALDSRTAGATETRGTGGAAEGLARLMRGVLETGKAPSTPAPSEPRKGRRRVRRD